MFVIDVVRNNQMPNLSSLYQAERTARYEEFTPFLPWATVPPVQTPLVISTVCLLLFLLPSGSSVIALHEITKCSPFIVHDSLRKQQTFSDTSGFPAKWHLRNEHRNVILMTCHNPDLGSSSDWLKICFIQSQALPRSSLSLVIRS